jgi:tetratricopeptide (TPR) repeat protein
MARTIGVRGRPPAALIPFLCLILGCLFPLRSQQFTVRGELRSSAFTLFSDYTVELRDSSGSRSFSGVDVRNDGSFELTGVVAGEYRLVVSLRNGGPVCERFISLSPSTTILSVRLPPSATRLAPGAQTVSVIQLLHPPSRKAQRYFREAYKLSAGGNYVKAAKALETAVQQSPEYAEAHTNLGVQYIRLNRLQDAIAEFDRALEIAGPATVPLCNRAWVEMKLGRFKQSEESAREALRLDNSYTKGHLILGTLLASDPNTRQEAVQHLRRAEGDFQSARKILAGLEAR